MVQVLLNLTNPLFIPLQQKTPNRLTQKIASNKNLKTEKKKMPQPQAILQNLNPEAI